MRMSKHGCILVAMEIEAYSSHAEGDYSRENLTALSDRYSVNLVSNNDPFFLSVIAVYVISKMSITVVQRYIGFWGRLPPTVSSRLL